MNLQHMTPWNWFRNDEPGGELMTGPGATDPFVRMHREMDRMLRDFFGTERGEQMLLRPSVDVAESRKAYRITVEVPGIEPSEIDLRVERGALIVSGEKRREQESDDEGFHRIERGYGQFRRVLALPDDADFENIRAEAHNGVLKIRVPRLKVESAPKARKIDITPQ